MKYIAMVGLFCYECHTCCAVTHIAEDAGIDAMLLAKIDNSALHKKESMLAIYRAVLNSYKLKCSDEASCKRSFG